MARTQPWIIVGGGASGLAAAYFLKQRGLESAIVEQDQTIGGRIGTVTLGDRPVDCGGKNIGKRYLLFRQFAQSLGQHQLEYFGLNSSQVIDGKVRTFEASARWRTMAQLARGVAPSDVLRFGRVLWRVKSDEAAGFLGSKYCRTLERRYDAAPASRYFSSEFSQRIVRPMSVRMNGAEPDEIHMGTLPSNVRMVLDTYEQFTHGLGPVLRAFAERYRVHTDTSVEELLVEGNRVVGVRARELGGRTRELTGAGVIVAAPAPVAACLTESLLPRLGDALRSIAYHPVALVLAEYDRPIFAPTTRAFVFDRHHALSNAGAYGVNDLHIVRYTFSGAESRRYLDERAGDEALLEIGERSLRSCVPVDPAWRRRFLVRRFNPGLCAYTGHHGAFLDAVGEQLGTVRGLHLTGDYIQGASIEACFRSSFACVQQLAGMPAEELPRRAAVPVSAALH
jgi:oxygen-dependent protoporphyrinogen oxidase